MGRSPGPKALWDFDVRLMAGAPGVGVDEAGRGPLAGPVVAAAVLKPAGERPRISGVRDSKTLSASEHLRIWREARALGIRFALGSASPAEIDEHNILRASHLAMRRAVARLAPPTEALILIDGPHPIRDFPYHQRAVVDGDAKSWTTALAGILAKAARDRWMRLLALRHPGYGWAANKGYGTRDHLGALDVLGPCAQHRRSFAPVRESTLAA